jgi:hypothetical protein
LADGDDDVQEGWGRGWVGVRPLQEIRWSRHDEVLRAVQACALLQRGVSEVTLEKRGTQARMWERRWQWRSR